MLLIVKRSLFEAPHNAITIWWNGVTRVSQSLRDGMAPDHALMRGTLKKQTVALGNGETKIVNHFYVTSIEVSGRSKRTSITVYEKTKT